ncbi:MAG: DNA starvation/stationary phase protection protein Dps [Acidobacteria bacterium]|nr:DNA starvation/stationary phase protection protein Dps [Acidobacteriota bacterium]MBI3487208.1 DNA starvation/stationary phase protection protein Dps [Acidobacteriota bacterium]
MSKHESIADHELFEGKVTEELVAMLNQSLADTLDLAYQTKQAHWNVKGPNFYSLHLLFDALYAQLSTYVDDFAERAVTLGGQAHGTIRAASVASSLDEYPIEAKKGMAHVNALVDRYSDYTSRVRLGIRKAEKCGDKDSADLYTSVSRAMDKALWMLTSHQEA